MFRPTREPRNPEIPNGARKGHTVTCPYCQAAQEVPANAAKYECVRCWRVVVISSDRTAAK